MSKEWTEGTCNESSGFLFRHECFQLPQNHCAACGKPICEEHTRTVDGKTLCPACEQAEARASGQTTGQQRGGYYHDPYYYGGTYYSGYGHYGTSHMGRTHSGGAGGVPTDPNDLQAGDAESLRNEGDEDFENDMSES